MARKKQVQEATDILDNLEVQQAHEMGNTLGSTSTKLRNQVVISLLDTARVYMLNPDTDEAILRSRVQSLIKIADTVVDELEKSND